MVAVGNPKTLQDWNFRAGSLAVQLRDVLHSWDTFAQELDAEPDQELLDLGMPQDAIDIMRSATTDAEDFSGVFNGKDSQFLTGNHDFTAFIKLLYGVV